MNDIKTRAICNTEDLNLVIKEDGEHQIWFHDLLCLGGGKDFIEARVEALVSLASILKQLAVATPHDK